MTPLRPCDTLCGDTLREPVYDVVVKPPGPARDGLRRVCRLEVDTINDVVVNPDSVPLSGIKELVQDPVVELVDVPPVLEEVVDSTSEASLRNDCVLPICVSDVDYVAWDTANCESKQSDGEWYYSRHSQFDKDHLVHNLGPALTRFKHDVLYKRKYHECDDCECGQQVERNHHCRTRVVRVRMVFIVVIIL